MQRYLGAILVLALVGQVILTPVAVAGSVHKSALSTYGDVLSQEELENLSGENWAVAAYAAFGAASTAFDYWYENRRKRRSLAWYARGAASVVVGGSSSAMSGAIATVKELSTTAQVGFHVYNAVKVRVVNWALSLGNDS